MNVSIPEFLRFKTQLEGAIAQVSQEHFFEQIGVQGNSIAVILKHLTGNFLSRFTDFLTSDGEKGWRDCDSEFTQDQSGKGDLMARWAKAWDVLEDAIGSLGREDIDQTIIIRGVTFTVEEALARSLSHFSYHVGQIVFLAKYFAGNRWNYLTIPPGESRNYNQNPTKERNI